MFRHSYYIRQFFHHRLLGRYLLLTNTVSSCALDALGDALEQRVERVSPHDWPRTLRFGTVGLLMGPIDHFWYRYLDFQFPGVRATTIAKKVTLDMLVLSPFQILLFYFRELLHYILYRGYNHFTCFQSCANWRAKVGRKQ